MSIVYSLISRGTTVFCEHTGYDPLRVEFLFVAAADVLVLNFSQRRVAASAATFSRSRGQFSRRLMLLKMQSTRTGESRSRSRSQGGLFVWHLAWIAWLG